MPRSASPIDLQDSGVVGDVLTDLFGDLIGDPLVALADRRARAVAAG